MSKKCLIISGGKFDSAAAGTVCSGTDTACPDADTPAYDLVIACDRGYEHARRLGLKPDIFIGDFDSFHGNVGEGTEVITLPHVKDDTDTYYAAKYALSRGCDSITIACALGGRLDHLYSNIQTLCYIASQGAAASIISDDTVMLTVCGPGTADLPRLNGWAFSVFSAADICRGVTISGAEYPVTDAGLTNTFPIGQSNSWAEDEVRISCEEGILLIIESRLPAV